MNQTYAKALGTALIISAGVLGIVGWPLSQRPPNYSATTTVKVVRDEADPPDLSHLPGLAPGADNAIFIQSEIALLQSEATLNKVVTNLDLSRAWSARLSVGESLSPVETLQRLKAHLQVQPGADPTFINITAHSDDPAEAAEIANATARAYCEYRADYRRRLKQNALEAVAGRHAEMEQAITDARGKLDQIAQQIDPAQREQADPGAAAVESETLRALRRRLSESLLHYIAQSNQLALYQAHAADGDENVGQLKARAEKAKAEMVAAETATGEELRKQESLQDYRAARHELDELLKRFAPIHKTVTELQNELRSPGRPPAEIIESASKPTIPDTREAARGRLWLMGGGLALVAGAGLLLFSRKP